MNATLDTFLLPYFELQEVATLGPCRVMALIGDSSNLGADYMLAEDAISQGDLVIEEVSIEGQVPQLRVSNRSDQPVLILEGDILVGGKQNRLCNSTVMVPAHSTLDIPVSCVESRRWRYRSQKFSTSSSSSSIDVLRRLKAGKFGRRSHRSDQQAIWRTIEHVQRQVQHSSSTTDHEELMRIRREDLGEFLDQNPCPEDAIGVAVIVGSVGYVLDLFDKPSTCRHYWRQKIHSAMAVALYGVGRVQPASMDRLEEEIEELPENRWTTVGTVGLGLERRAITRHHSLVTGFYLDDVPVHVNLISRE
jgi:hypothetical protein